MSAFKRFCSELYMWTCFIFFLFMVGLVFALFVCIVFSPVLLLFWIIGHVLRHFIVVVHF